MVTRRLVANNKLERILNQVAVVCLKSTIPSFMWKLLKTKEMLVKIAGFRINIWTQDLLNMKQKCKSCNQDIQQQSQHAR